MQVARAAPQDAQADLLVQPGGGADGRAHAGGEVAGAQLRAAVELVGPRQHPLHGDEHRLGRPHHALRSQARRQPRRGQVDAVPGRVLRHVAGDVGQLHRHAEVDGVGLRPRVPRIQHGAHHQPHRARNPVGIAEQPRLVGNPDAADVVQHGVDQGDCGRRADAGAPLQREELRRLRLLPVARQDRPADGVQGGPGMRRVSRLVGQVVHRAAEGVQRRGVRQGGARQQPAGQAEAAAVLGQHGDAHRTGSARSSASTTLADVTTPGTPAPGCVPAPTRYRPGAGPWLWKRNQADCSSVGATEKPAPWRLR